MKTITIFNLAFLFLVISCQKQTKDNLELLILNDTLITYSGNSKNDSINIIRYSISNHSDDVYYINNDIKTDSLFKIAIYKNGVNLLVFNDKHEEVEYDMSHSTDPGVSCFVEYAYRRANKLEDMLGYRYRMDYFINYDNKNFFFIYPNQTIYFEYPLALNRPTNFDDTRMGGVYLDKSGKYYARLSIASDSTVYRAFLPREIIQTIKVNKAKVYHGNLKSKNEIPIKVIE